MKRVLFLMMTMKLFSIFTVGATDLDILANYISTGLKEELRYDVKTIESRGMDCLKIIPAEDYATNDDHFYGVYHRLTNGSWMLYLAESTNGIDGQWSTITTLSNNGTMGYLYYDEVTGFYILAYEYMSAADGNNIHIRFFENISDLKNNNEVYSTFLKKNIHLPADNNTYGVDPSIDIRNIGTPNITSVDYQDGIWTSYIRFHFTTIISPDADIPGYGVVSFNPSKEYNNGGPFFNWQGYFDNDANNAIQIARNVGGGKIGQRDVITWNGNNYYLYEAQLNNNFAWSNWRLYLYSHTEQRAVEITLNLPGIVSLANPATTLVGNKLILTLFIPTYDENGVVMPLSGAGTFVCSLDLSNL